MENLRTRIKTFLNISYNLAYNINNSFNFDYGKGKSSACGGCDGHGVGSGLSSGCDYFGYGYSYCYGSEIGADIGKGNGYGHGIKALENIKELNGDNVYLIDNMHTIIKSIRGNIAQGFIIHSDFTSSPCYIVKEQNHFAHGVTLHDAFEALQEKLYDDSTTEERIEAFLKKFTNYDTPYPNRELFTYHHVLTGSCRMGREGFCKDNNIDLDGKTTIREFVSLTKNNYGSEVIRKLPKAYGINNFKN